MSSNRGLRQVVSGWIEFKLDDYIRTGWEVLITVFFTFLPFLALSVPWKKLEPAISWEIFLGNFEKFWSSGEMTLPILGWCGAIAAIIAVNGLYFRRSSRVIVYLIVLSTTFAGGMAISESGGFAQELQNEVISVGFVIYGVLAFIWFLLAAKVKTDEPRTRKSEDHADEILRKAQELRRHTGDPT